LVQAKTLVARGSQFAAVDFQAVRKEFASRIALISKHIGQATIKDVLPPAENVVRVSANEVVSKPAEVVTRELADSGLVVNRVLPYDEALSGNAIKEIGNVPLDLKPGEKITLFTDNQGKVAFFTRDTSVLTPAAVQPVVSGAVRSERRDVAALRAQVDALKADLATRNRELAALKKSLDSMAKTVAELAPMKRPRVQRAKRTPNK
jgi:hypothetical protein